MKMRMYNAMSDARGKSARLGGGGSKCGVMMMAYGAPDSKYIKNALRTIARIRSESLPPGWCRGDPTLTEIPVTFVTDVSHEVFLSLLNDTGVSVDNNEGFEELKVDGKISKQWSRIGAPEYRWYHCQAFKQTPYDLMLYIDADVGVCDVDRLGKLFSEMADSEADLGYEHSIYDGGYMMTNGDRDNPHPAGVLTTKDKKSWAAEREPNAGVIFYRKDHEVARKWADDVCRNLYEAFTLPGVKGDQYAFRAANWENRQALKKNVFVESKQKSSKNKICRYEGSCRTGCAVVHGWRYFET
jgi:hypothetical protein